MLNAARLGVPRRRATVDDKCANNVPDVFAGDAQMQLLNDHHARVLLAAVVTILLSTAAQAQPVHIGNVPCVSPPPLHCPDADCPNEVVAHRGNAFLPRNNRPFFLDYPCDLKAGEAVTFILSLHGGGMVGNWHRHYFPLVDFKEKYRLIVATPSAIKVLWDPENDDGHLRNIVNFVYEQIGAKNIKAFWLAGHSHGGLTADRLLRTPFFRDKLTGWVSLSGGRWGSPRAYVPPVDSTSPYLVPFRDRLHAGLTPDPPCSDAPGVGLGDACSLPDYSLSHIYTSGEYELTAAGLPDHSLWAHTLGCQAQARQADIVDRKAGYVWDSRSPRTRNTRSGRQPRPGRARVFVYPECRDGHVVADVIRLDKGHTEGLEPRVTEEIVRLMLSAGKAGSRPNQQHLQRR
jgi:hypothetical protein